eukprot:6426074-Amphidinium_carterae.1
MFEDARLNVLGNQSLGLHEPITISRKVETRLSTNVQAIRKPSARVNQKDHVPHPDSDVLINRV